MGEQSESSGEKGGDNDGFIAAFKLNNTDGEKLTLKSTPDMYTLRPVHKDSEKYMRCNADAGGSSMKLDKFGNLIFLARDGEGIMKIKSEMLSKVFNLPPRSNLANLKINVTCEDLYTPESTKYATNISGITLEREYVYWTNNLNESTADQSSAVVKAFSEPFIKQVPLQTFQVSSQNGAKLIAANSAFLFFTVGDTIQAINKHGYTKLFFNLGVPLTDPVCMTPYRDDLVLIAEKDQLSYIDVSRLAFNFDDPLVPAVPTLTKNKLLETLPNGMPVHSVIIVTRD